MVASSVVVEKYPIPTFLSLFGHCGLSALLEFATEDVLVRKYNDVECDVEINDDEEIEGGSATFQIVLYEGEWKVHGLYKTAITTIHYKYGYIHQEDDLPAIILTEDGYVFKEWRVNGKRHRDNDRPAYQKFDMYGNIIVEIWYIEDQIHRNEDQPSHISRDSSGNIVLKAWHQHGLLHRDNDLPAFVQKIGHHTILIYHQQGKRHRDNDRPAYQKFDMYGNIIVGIWYIEGQIHRNEDLPTLFVRDSSGNIVTKAWHQHGLLHRDNDLPAFIKKTEHKAVVSWYRQGKYHRLNGLPAVRVYDYITKKMHELWVINGVCMDPPHVPELEESSQEDRPELEAPTQ